MKRQDGRAVDQLRSLTVERNFLKWAEGSCLLQLGDTKVVCSATVERTVPLFLRGKSSGWVTSEYGMLPRSTSNRIQRDRISGRKMEIQRLVGRSLRSIVNLNRLGERTIWVDCDVIQADGGTRVASVIGGFIALADAVKGLVKEGSLSESILTDYLGAISVGVLKGTPVLDLCFAEDSGADVDMNLVMKGCGEFVEIQGTAERGSFSQKELNELLELGKKGIEEIIGIQKKLFADLVPKF